MKRVYDCIIIHTGEDATIMEEVWKDIPDYEGKYQASTFGNVKSLDCLIVNGFGNTHKRLFPGRILKRFLMQNGYYQVTLSNNGITKKFVVHRLTALVFLPNPENKKEVNHKNGIKTDNRISNLEWVTPKENMQHAHDTGLFKKILPNKNYKHHRSLTDEQVLHILNIKKESTISNKEIGRKFNISGKNIGCIIRGVTYKHIAR